MSVLRAAQTRSLCISACRTWNWSRTGLHLFWRNAQSRSYAGKPSGRSGRTNPSTLRLGSTQGNLNLERSRRYIKNLNPHTIHPDDYMDISGRTVMPCVLFEDETREIKPFDFSLSWIRSHLKFPEGCRGFLYFYQDPLGRPTVSGLRFRIAEEPTQTGFGHGKDFQRGGSSEPWSYSLLRLACTSTPGADNILERLYTDGLVNPADVAKWVNILDASRLFADGHYPKRLLTSLDEPFEIELSGANQCFYLFDPDRSRLLKFTVSPVMETYRRWHTLRPYKGRCIIRFDKVEETETSDVTDYYRFKVFVLKVLTPIQCTIPEYNGIEFPKEGSYLCRNGKPIIRCIKFKVYDRPQNFETTDSKPLRGEPGRKISTLNPVKISSKDYLDFPQETGDSLYTSAHGATTMKRGQRETTVISNALSLTRASLKEDFRGKKGFLYYCQEAADVPLSGRLRFRLADRPSVTAFRRGRDLNISELDIAWQLPLLRIVNSLNLAPLLAQLVQDGLVTDETITKCRRLIEAHQRLPLKTKTSSQIIYSLEEPFIVDFDASHRVTYVLDAEVCRIWWMQPLRQYKYPFTGKCLVRCEVIPRGPDEPNPSHRTVQFRVVKILEPFRWRNPVEPDNRWELPQVNALITRRGVPAKGQLYQNVDAGADVEGNDIT